VEDAEQDALDHSFESEEDHRPRFERIRTGRSVRSARSAKSERSRSGYESNPYDIDRVATRGSFKSRASSVARSTKSAR
ncbi:hypothetical protein LTR66_012850, partial [Elasticomyces elasticus]